MYGAHVMTCPQCAGPLPAASRFCTGCGAPNAALAAPPPPAPARNDRSGRAWVVGLVVALVLCLVGGLATVLLLAGSDRSDHSSVASPAAPASAATSTRTVVTVVES